MAFLVKVSAVAAAIAVSALAVNAKSIDIPGLPAKINPSMTGFNDCQKRYGASSPDALCANSFINSIKVFCLFGPAQRGKTIGEVEGEVVSYCIKSGYGTRLMPEGTIKGAQFVKTKHFLQVVGVGDLTKINIQPGDDGGELDGHGAQNIGNPVGSLILTRSFDGTWRHTKEWTQFVSDKEFCFRACHGPQKADYCEHIYDMEGCAWNMPSANGYEEGKFEQCDGDEGEFPGVYNGKKWHREDGTPTPEPHKAPAVYNCRAKKGLGYGKPAKVIPGQPAKRSFGDDEFDPLEGNVLFARD